MHGLGILRFTEFGWVGFRLENALLRIVIVFAKTNERNNPKGHNPTHEKIVLRSNKNVG